MLGMGTKDPHKHHRELYRVFLEQSRWLFEEQHKRSVGFQQNAVALLGFDGVMLAFMASADFTDPGDDAVAQVAAVSGIVGVVLVAVSALIAVAAVVPRTVHGMTIEDVTAVWAEVHDPGKDNYDATQHFAHMLLNQNPTPVGPTSRFRQARAEVAADLRRWSGRSPRSAQTLLAARELADARGRLVAWSGALLGLGILALMIRLLTA